MPSNRITNFRKKKEVFLECLGKLLDSVKSMDGFPFSNDALTDLLENLVFMCQEILCEKSCRMRADCDHCSVRDTLAELRKYFSFVGRNNGQAIQRPRKLRFHRRKHDKTDHVRKEIT